MDRGLNKRTYAGTQDAIVVLGRPHLQDAPEPFSVRPFASFREQHYCIGRTAAAVATDRK